MDMEIEGKDLFLFVRTGAGQAAGHSMARHGTKRNHHEQHDWTGLE